MSKEFWNLNYEKIPNMEFELPDAVNHVLSTFQEKYSKVKQMRKL